MRGGGTGPTAVIHPAAVACDRPAGRGASCPVAPLACFLNVSVDLESDDIRSIRHGERSEAIQCRTKTPWIASLRSS